MKTIWIIEDDRLLGNLMTRLVNRLSEAFSASWHSDAALAFDELLRLLKTEGQLPDVILLDLFMPSWDGWQFLEAFRELDPDRVKDVRVFVLSSSINPEDHRRAGAYPQVLGVLTKPVSADTLMALI